jgi:integrase
VASARITKRAVDALEAGPSDAFLWDVDVKGFGIKVTPKGTKSYLLQYRLGGRGTRTRRYTIGTHGSPWTPDQARQRAGELLLDVRRGVDPLDAERARETQKVELGFSAYVELFTERYAKRAQPRSWKQSRQTLTRYAVPAFSRKALPEIGRRDVARLLESVTEEKPATARYLHACLRKLFRWAVSRGDLDHSPMSDMEAPAPVDARERVLSDAELVAIWKAAGSLGFPFGAAVRLLIATGQRREEVGGLRWEEIDVEAKTWTIPVSRAKNGVAHIVPLGPLAIAELRRIERTEAEYILSTTGRTPPSGWSKAKLRLDTLVAKQLERTPPSWRTHDLRRTVATGLQRLGIRFEVTEAILNHVSGSRSGVAGIYQRHDWADEKRAALVAWDAHLEHQISGKPNATVENVIPLNAMVGR